MNPLKRILGKESRGEGALARMGHSNGGYRCFERPPSERIIKPARLGVRAVVDLSSAEIIVSRNEAEGPTYPFVVDRDGEFIGTHCVDSLIDSLGNAFNPEVRLVRENMPWDETPESIRRLTRRALDSGMTIELRSKGE